MIRNPKSPFAVLLAALLFAAGAAAQTHWVAAWGAAAAPQLRDQRQMRSAGMVFDAQTVRVFFFKQKTAYEIRVRLSNAFGTSGVEIGAAHLAVRARDSAIAPGSDRTLTFSGNLSFTIPANAIALSDPVKLEVPAGGDVAISLFLPKGATGAATHYSAQQTNYV